MSTLEEKETLTQPENAQETAASDNLLAENEAVMTDAEDQEIVDYSSFSEAELVEKARTLITECKGSVSAIKRDIEDIKSCYYKSYNQNIDKIRSEQAEGGENAEPVDLPVDMFKSVYVVYQRRKKEEQAQKEAEMEKNLKAKLALIDRLKELAQNSKDARQDFNACREIQNEWKNIGAVPQAKADEVNGNYKLWIETFYDSLSAANELRDLDFRKNLEEKISICELAEGLAESKDVVDSFRKLQYYHERWKEIGPVAREKREELWERFKEATAVVNKRHREYFEQIHAKEEQNLVEKTKLCEEVENAKVENEESFDCWQKMTEFIVAKQEEWRKIGFAPKKDNDKIYERFRAACDKFFVAKNEFFKRMKETQSENLKKKISLCEIAESLKDSKDWKETTNKFVEIQKEWKTIGPVPRKNSDSVWKRFLAACDYFFEQKEADFANRKSEEAVNLEKKKDLIERIKGLQIEGNDNAFADFKKLLAEWNSIGHVPFKEKDNIYKKYKSTIDDVFDKLNKDRSINRLDFFKTNIETLASQGMAKVNNERKRLQKLVENFNSEIATAENNIGFFSKSSKGASPLLDGMKKKIAKLKDERNLLLEKIRLIDETTEEMN